jgi:solute carrier family 13 (sodium-dependent dicarboxylate transporter), member 2/3/5
MPSWNPTVGSGVASPPFAPTDARPASGARRGVQWAGLVTGPLAAIAVYVLLADVGSEPLSDEGRAVAALAAWMAVWWLTEALHVTVTALLPIALLPLTGAQTVEEATAPYASPLIFLFLGGFVLALSMQRWALDERIALLTLRFVGERPGHLVGGFMLATAVMSMWVSNTATVAMMLPIALSVAALVHRLRHTGADPAGADPPGDEVRESSDAADVEDGRGAPFSACLMLAIAYAASIGGLGTIIGTPPNLFVASYLRDTVGVEISFARWMLFGVPLVAVFLPVTWLLLTRALFRLPRDRVEGAQALARRRYARLGGLSRGEWSTLVVFTVTAGAWVFRPLLVEVEVAGVRPLAGLSDTSIAILAALALFVVPVDARRRVFVMDWRSAERLPWGVLLLFGGGLSLAGAIDATGVGAWIGRGVAGVGPLPVVLLIALTCLIVVSLTELTSNTATTAAFVPVLAAVAPALGLAPALLVVPVALTASAAFMMPVATPPNAIVFGSGHVTIPQMLRAGVWLNLITVLLVTATATVLLPRVLSG